MRKFAIRKGANDDFPELAKIISTSTAWTCFGIDFDIALNLFNEMEDTIHIAESDDQIIGFITTRINGIGNIGVYVRMVAVKENFRGQGIGRQLIDHVSQNAMRNTPNLFLICSVENIDAQRFYQKMGFVQVGILNDLVITGHDEILYRKTFGPLR